MVRPVAFEGADPEEDLVPFGLEEDGGWRRVMSGDGAAGGDGYRGDVAGAFLAGRRGRDRWTRSSMRWPRPMLRALDWGVVSTSDA